MGRPIALSGDVEQRRFALHETGRRLEDPHVHRWAAVRLRAGAWIVDAGLAARPAGPLPDRVAGASPAYDLREVRAAVADIVVRPAGP